jgi:hypothetical protein
MSQQQLEAVAQCIAEVIPMATLRGITEQHQIVPQFDHLAKTYTGPVDGRDRSVVEQVLELYQGQQVLPILLEALYEFSHTVSASEHLRSLLEPGLPGGTRKEALLARRDNFFLSQDLLSDLAQFTPKVCCIVGRFTVNGKTFENQGTGFLVGPDLLLTAMHVLEPLNVLNPEQVPASFQVFFDHSKGGALNLDGSLPDTVRCVELAQDWLVAGARSYDQDGKIDEPDAQQQAAMQEQLDFVLIRLKDSVGLQPVHPSGGRARAWITLPDPQSTGKLVRDERLVITQHPAGQAQCVDFGRFERMCTSQTRMFYSVSTAPGSSGAPCFNRAFELVGMHNAKFQPKGHVLANQAIRFDRIQPFIAPHIEYNGLPAPATRLWNISLDPSRCLPVIGRGVLQKWIEDSTGAHSSQRFFAMVAQPGEGGHSFSRVVLEHRLKDNPQFLAVAFDRDNTALALQLEEFVAALAKKFDIVLAEAPPMPARHADDNEKVRRWASQLVPRWFCAQLDASRTSRNDRRQVAREIVAGNKQLGRVSDQELLELAGSPEPIIVEVEHWTQAWLVFDDLHVMTLSQEIQDFLAGMVQIDTSDNESFRVLRRLRWMFLGHRPGFLDPSLVCVETIDARTYLDGIDQLGKDIISAAQYDLGNVIQSAIDVIKLTMTSLAETDFTPAQRLAFLQKVAGTTLTEKLPIWMKR